MRTLNCVHIFVLMFICQNVSASRINLSVTPSIIYPILTKTLQLRCSVQSLLRQNVSQVLLPAMNRRTEVISPTLEIVRQIIWQTDRTEEMATQTATTTHMTTQTKTATTANPSLQTTKPAHTEAQISHITSIIVSKQDNITGQKQKVASISSFDPPTASIDFDQITVNGESNSSPIAGEQGYLEMTWSYPVIAQSGLYTCEVFGLDSTLHPVSISESVQIRSNEPNVPELASILAQNDKYITELRETVSELKNQISDLKLQDLAHDQAMYNISEIIQQRPANIKAQNIQTGVQFCNFPVRFHKAFNSIPLVFLTINNFGPNSITNFMVEAENVTEIGFIPYCNSIHYGISLTWIAIDN